MMGNATNETAVKARERTAARSWKIRKYEGNISVSTYFSVSVSRMMSHVYQNTPPPHLGVPQVSNSNQMEKPQSIYPNDGG